MKNYDYVIASEFRKAFGSASNNFMTDIDPASIDSHSLFLETLKVIEGCEHPDDAAAALSKRGDDLQKLAERSRMTPEWGDICIAMGAVRNSAVAVWR